MIIEYFVFPLLSVKRSSYYRTT